MARCILLPGLLLLSYLLLAAASDVVATMASQADPSSTELAVNQEATVQDTQSEIYDVASLDRKARKLGKCLTLDRKHIVSCTGAAVDPRPPPKHVSYSAALAQAKRRANRYEALSNSNTFSQPAPVRYTRSKMQYFMDVSEAYPELDDSAQAAGSEHQPVPPAPLSQQVSKKQKQRKPLTLHVSPGAVQRHHAEADNAEYGGATAQQRAAVKMQKQRKFKVSKYVAAPSKLEPVNQQTAEDYTGGSKDSTYAGAEHQQHPAGYSKAKLYRLPSRSSTPPLPPSPDKHEKKAATAPSAGAKQRTEQDTIGKQELYQELEQDAVVAEEQEDAHAVVQPGAAADPSISTAAGKKQENVKRQEPEKQQAEADVDVTSHEYWTTLSLKAAKPGFAA